jgi:hypothetical protein
MRSAETRYGPSAAGGVAESLAEAKAAFQAAWDAPEMKKPRDVLRNESSRQEVHTEIPMCGPVRLAEICERGLGGSVRGARGNSRPYRDSP